MLKEKEKATEIKYRRFIYCMMNIIKYVEMLTKMLILYLFTYN